MISNFAHASAFLHPLSYPAVGYAEGKFPSAENTTERQKVVSLKSESEL